MRERRIQRCLQRVLLVLSRCQCDKDPLLLLKLATLASVVGNRAVQRNLLARLGDFIRMVLKSLLLSSEFLLLSLSLKSRLLLSNQLLLSQLLLSQLLRQRPLLRCRLRCRLREPRALLIIIHAIINLLLVYRSFVELV